MNSRLTIQDLAAMLAERTGKNKADAELFLREFIAVVSQGVLTDKVVRIKGLGTFKITLVGDRESVHVNTGERFLIPAHHKFSFLPDKELREQVNKPFAFFETTELNETVDFTDLDVSSEIEEKETEDESVEEEITEIAQPEVQPEAPQQEPVEEPEPSPVSPEQPAVEEKEKPVDQLTPNDFADEEILPENKKITSWIKIAVPIIVFAIVAIAGLLVYMNRDLFLGSKTEPLPRTPIETVIPEEPKKAETTETAADSTLITTSPADTSAAVTPTPEPVSEVLAKVKIEPGSRLTLISLEYYGHKIFWVYLYEYNKASIKDPNNIPVGTEILVPDPSVYGIDKQNRSSIEKAAARQTEILSGNL